MRARAREYTMSICIYIKKNLKKKKYTGFFLGLHLWEEEYWGTTQKLSKRGNIAIKWHQVTRIKVRGKKIFKIEKKKNIFVCLTMQFFLFNYFNQLKDNFSLIIALRFEICFFVDDFMYNNLSNNYFHISSLTCIYCLIISIDNDKYVIFILKLYCDLQKHQHTWLWQIIQWKVHLICSIFLPIDRLSIFFFSFIFCKICNFLYFSLVYMYLQYS